MADSDDIPLTSNSNSKGPKLGLFKLLGLLLGKIFKISSGKLAAIGIVAVLFLTLAQSFTTRDAGYIYVVQDTLMGKYRTFIETGVHFQVPYFTNVTKYKRAATISFGDAKGVYTKTEPGVQVQFADTYTGTVPVTMRFRMPLSEDKIIEMHKEFRSFENLVESLLIKNAKNVTVVTGTQYTGEEFFQGGVNSYKGKLEDQLRNGLYLTVRKQVEIEQTGMAAVSVENSSPSKLETTTRLVWKNVIQMDPETGHPLRMENPFDRYGISVSQVTIDKPIPDAKLERLLDGKRELVAKRINAVQQIETAEAEARAAQQQMEIEKRRAIQQAQKEKDLAVIAEAKKVAMERQQAELQLVKKEKERKMALADRDIQEAAAQAAVFEAQKIKSVGLANAEVIKAEYLAKQAAREIFLAETELAIAKVVYPNLRGAKITMPQYVANGGGNSGNLPNSLEVFSTLGAIDLLKKQTAPAPKSK